MKRNGFQVMSRLIGLVKPLTGYMFLAISMGLMGHLAASWITVLGGFAPNPFGIRCDFCGSTCFSVCTRFPALCRTGVQSLYCF